MCSIWKLLVFYTPIGIFYYTIEEWYIIVDIVIDEFRHTSLQPLHIVG